MAERMLIRTNQAINIPISKRVQTQSLILITNIFMKTIRSIQTTPYLGTYKNIKFINTKK